MGKIYKNSNPLPQKTISPIQNIPAPTLPTFSLPEAKTVPLEQFDLLLESAQQMILQSRYSDALVILLNLEVTRFDFIPVHELLADIFLKLDQLELAKEQLEICAQLIKKETAQNIFTLKSFDQLVSDAGNFDELNKEFNTIKKQNITEDNILQGTKVALNLATHHIANKQYLEAEKLLIEYRTRYLEFLEKQNS